MCDNEQITEHQPDIEVVDLTCSESMSDMSCGSDEHSDGGDSDFVQSSRCYIRYAEHFHDLLVEFYNDARHGNMLKDGDEQNWMDQTIEEWIWKLIDNDLRKA